MRYVTGLALVVALTGIAVTAQGQSAPPDLRGTWTMKGKTVVYGANQHHPGPPAPVSPPRVRDADFTMVVEGQEGRLAWGYNFSKVAPDNKEPFAWAITADGKTIIGTDTDGYYNITIQGPDRMELCYVHAGLSPSKSIVATCMMADRQKR
jgi:hypothetical protein